jgi:hypothetical protein
MAVVTSLASKPDLKNAPFIIFGIAYIACSVNAYFIIKKQNAK